MMIGSLLADGAAVRRHVCRLTLALLVGLVVACVPTGTGINPFAREPGPTATSVKDKGDHQMEADTYFGPIPDDLDIRVQRRDVQPLPPGALVKFQVISRGKNPQYNYRWILYADGTWYLAWHSGDSSDWQTPFDTEIPAEPTGRLPNNVVDQVRQHLQEADFWNQPPYQADETVEDGAFYIVTARKNGSQGNGAVHEVIYEAVYPPLVAFLDTLATTYETAQPSRLATFVSRLLPRRQS
jgi:hypothetical protein